MLTEETGFSGGMLWTGNNIDSSHLKAIVNFDYEDTTGFLKTRAPIIATDILDKKGNAIRLNNALEATLIGVYNMSPSRFVQTSEGSESYEYDGIDTSGYFYLFGNVNIDAAGDQYCANIQGLFRDTQQDNWYTVDCTEVNRLFKPDTGVGIRFKQSNRISPVLKDNILYFTTDAEDRIFLACRLNNTHNVVGELTNVDLVPQSNNPENSGDQGWLSYCNAVNSFNLLTIGGYGFNAARGENMYIYESNADYSDTQHVILGAYLTEKINSKIPITSPRIGQSVYVNVKINGTNTYKGHKVSVFQQTKGRSEEEPLWEYLAESTITDVGAVIKCTITESNPTFLLCLYSTADTKDITKADETLKTNTFNSNNALDNLKTQPYNLNKAKASCLWNNHLVLWGCQKFESTLFISEPDNFYYFPVPRNVVVTDTDIVNCVPYLNSLLIFTTSKLYKLTEDNEGNFIQEIIQNNLPIAPADAAHIKAIKNMVLFKSGKYFYMVVPKSQSLTGELTIAPIYKNIAGLLNNLAAGVTEILLAMYPEYASTPTTATVTMSDYPTYIYSAQDTVHILYEVLYNTRRYMLFLNYNTNLRAWTMYVVDTSNETLAPTYLTASQLMAFVRVNNNPSDKKVSIAQFTPDTDVTDAFRSLLDTGYRTLSASFKKRFREIQLKVYCSSEESTAFGSSFLLDGVCRRNYVKLTETYVDDQTVLLVPDYTLNTFITEPTMGIDSLGLPAHQSSLMQQTDPAQGSDSIALDNWKLDFSHFKREAPTVIRIPVAGKGYAPRFILMSPSSLSLCVNEINWVYRLMYGR